MLVDLGDGLALNPTSIAACEIIPFGVNGYGLSFRLIGDEPSPNNTHFIGTEEEAKAAYAQLTATAPTGHGLLACKYWYAYTVDGNRLEFGADTLAELMDMCPAVKQQVQKARQHEFKVTF